MSKSNIAMLEAHQCNYIIAAKLRVMPKDLNGKILDVSKYTIKQYGKVDIGWFGEFDYQWSRLVVTYKTVRAKCDEKQRG